MARTPSSLSTIQMIVARLTRPMQDTERLLSKEINQHKMSNTKNIKNQNGGRRSANKQPKQITLN
jgi:hypothetical protein